MTISLGVPGNSDHPKMIETIEKIRDGCLRHGIVGQVQLVFYGLL